MTIIPKYRLLTAEELKGLETQFVRYLASQGVSADLWQRYQSSKDLQLDLHLTRFSDQVLETVYQDCKLIESVSQNAWIFYTFDQEKVYMQGLLFDESLEIDLRRLNSEQLQQCYENAPEGSIKLIRAEKKLDNGKEQQVHQLLSEGGFISKNQAMQSRLAALF
jgi:hypothetical protein